VGSDVGPLEVFLYDWRPIRADAILFDRLASMPVRISYKAAAAAESDAERQRSGWHAVPIEPGGQR
jgi:hypothetical protein